MSRSIARLLNATMSIERPERATAGAGFVETAQQVASGVPCRRSPLSSGDQDFAASAQLIATHAIYTGPSVDVRRDDVLTIGAISYEARAVLEPSDTLYRKVLAEEIQTGT